MMFKLILLLILITGTVTAASEAKFNDNDDNAASVTETHEDNASEDAVAQNQNQSETTQDALPVMPAGTVADSRSIYSYNLSQEYDAGTGSCKPRSYVLLMAKNRTCGLEYEDGDSDDFLPLDGHKRVSCKPRKFIPENITVEIVSSMELLSYLTLKQEGYIGRCMVVLFYTPYCVYSARLAPQYNAVARLFPNLFVLAVDASTFHTLNSRYGTVAVPNILVFHNGRVLSKFNQSERSLEQISSYLVNVTGMTPNGTVVVREEDYLGPLSSTPEQPFDYLLWLSNVFIAIFCAVVFSRSVYAQKVVEAFTHKGQNVIT